MLRPLLVVSLALASLASAAWATGPCDGPGPASRVAADQTAWTNLVPANGTGQTFTATRRHVTGVEVYVVTGNPQPDVEETLTLTLSGFGGDLLAQTTLAVVSGYEGWLCFPMPEDGIDVTPGETLVLHLRDTGKVIFGWRYGPNTYPRGHALMLNRAARRFDFAFRVHDATVGAGAS
jgi:hypothetical protein